MDLQPASTPNTVSDERPDNARTQLHGRWLIFVRIFCIVLIAYTLGFFATGIVAAFAQHQAVCTGLTCVLSIPEALVYFAVAALIFWRKSDDWMALLAALMLVLLAPLSTLPEEILIFMVSVPVIGALLDVSLYLAIASFLLFCFLFPNGRFVPRWTLWVVPVSLLWFAYFIYGFFWLPDTGEAGGYQIMAILGLLLIIAFAQFYRYSEVSSPRERQQTKWAILGVSVAAWAWFFSIFFWVSITRVILLLVPLSIGIAVLRYRLYNIDVLINRTLIYGTLTGILALVYFGLVFALQFLLRGLISQTNNVAIVVSTLAVYVLFQPLPRWIQQIIDRRFYCRKYDAAKTLEAFSATLRSEVDLNQLREQLLKVVQETMQPAHISLWLRSPQRHTEEPRRPEKPNTIEV